MNRSHMRRHAEYVDNLHPPTTGAVSTGQHAHASSNLDAWALLLPRQTGGTGRPRSHRRPRGGCVDLACPKRMKGTRAGKTFAANTSLPQPLKHLWQSRQLQRLKYPVNKRRNLRNPHCGIWPESNLPTRRRNRTGPNVIVHDSSFSQSTRSSPYSPCRARCVQV